MFYPSARQVGYEEKLWEVKLMDFCRKSHEQRAFWTGRFEAARAFWEKGPKIHQKSARF
jgi:hypothetical protein